MISSNLKRDSEGALYTAPHFHQKLRYTAISDVSPVDPGLIPRKQGAIPEAIRQSCLRLPLLDPRIAELARQVRGRQPDAFSKAQTLERYRRRSYRYSLHLTGRPRSADPLAVFLFETRAGHCEYFATAMAIMLRQVGIPGRLVNGFRAGEYNALGDAWVVRQYDAHSWIEAYFSPYGLIEFDPTPVERRQTKSALARWVSSVTEAVDMWWWEGVVVVSQLEQERTAVVAALSLPATEVGHEFEGDLREQGAFRAVGREEAAHRLLGQWPHRAAAPEASLRESESMTGRRQPARPTIGAANFRAGNLDERVAA